SSSTRNRAYFRNVARLGGEAAAALEHAHQVGIVHRDIKPANLMVDVKGHLWVTDFGLARLQSDSGLTITGDLVGTLRYMSPEQALGQRGYLDHRTDIYSLGVTLYELLTLAPAFGGQDRIALLRRIAEEEPRAPRKLDETIPRDLETIVLKAMAKEPAARYRTAQELADDLGRFLEHKPIRARRPTTWDRALKLCRRHAGLVAAALVMLLLAAAALAAALVRIGHERDLAAASAQAARERAVDLERQLYINRINRAHGEWQGNNLALAEALLENCPPRSRGWEWYFCRELCHLEQLTWQGDGRPIHSLAFSPDGRWILTAANGPDPPERGPGSWTIWDAERGRALASRPLPGAHVVAVHPTGTRVAVGSSAPDGQPGSIAVWDVLPGWPPRLAAEPRLVLRTQPPLVEGLAFSPDGRRIAALSTEEPRGFVELWQLDTGRRELVTEIKSRLRGLAFHPNGTQLAVGGKDGTVHLLDTASGAAHGVLRGHTGEVFTVAYSPDGRCLVSGGWDETVRTWDVASGRPGHVLRGHDSFVRAVAISPEGSRIASASEDNTARLWDAASGKPIGTLRGHRGFVRAVAFSPGGQRLASASDDGSVKLWDSTATGPARTLRHPHWVSRVAYAPDGSTLASASWDGSVLRWDVADGRQLWSRRDTRSRILGLAIRPDGAVIAESDESAQIRLRDSSTGRLLRELRDHRARVYSVAFSPDGRELASISADGTLRVWDAATGESFVFFQTPAGVHPITAIYSPEGRRIAAAVADGTVRILDRSTGRERLRLDCPGLPEQGSSMNGILAFDPTGRRLAAGANFGDKGTAEVRVFDTATGGRLFTLKGHTANITAVAFSPDGRRIASASFDRTVKLWETETGQEVFTLREHTAGVLSVAFSPDGRRLATGSIDYSAKIWDAPGAPRPGTGLDATDDPPSTDRKEGGTPR
ncbi:MAG TPA: protein kinase, partial [Isosphaeraceae bacterium]|nr:protein kinase [Isosphaeraceae bacterium]